MPRPLVHREILNSSGFVLFSMPYTFLCGVVLDVRVAFIAPEWSRGGATVTLTLVHRLLCIPASGEIVTCVYLPFLLLGFLQP